MSMFVPGVYEWHDKDGNVVGYTLIGDDTDDLLRIEPVPE